MAELPDRCPTCLCGDCGGQLDQHTVDGCGCEDCTYDPQHWCSLAEFKPPARIGFLFEQLGPLLSSHLDDAARLRCMAVAHAAHHALNDYDYPEEHPR